MSDDAVSVLADLSMKIVGRIGAEPV